MMCAASKHTHFRRGEGQLDRVITYFAWCCFTCMCDGRAMSCAVTFFVRLQRISVLHLNIWSMTFTKFNNMQRSLIWTFCFRKCHSIACIILLFLIQLILSQNSPYFEHCRIESIAIQKWSYYMLCCDDVGHRKLFVIHVKIWVRHFALHTLYYFCLIVGNAVTQIFKVMLSFWNVVAYILSIHLL